MRKPPEGVAFLLPIPQLRCRRHLVRATLVRQVERFRLNSSGVELLRGGVC